jgi:hypothetical protein
MEMKRLRLYLCLPMNIQKVPADRTASHRVHLDSKQALHKMAKIAVTSLRSNGVGLMYINNI